MFNIKILIVGENRNFVKKVCKTLEKITFMDFEIDIVFYSTSAFERIVTSMPDIIIIDSEIVLNFQVLLKEISQCTWNFNTYIFGVENLHHLSDGNFFYNYNDIENAVNNIFEKNNSININSKEGGNCNFNREKYEVQEKFYTVATYIYTGHENEIINKCKSKLIEDEIQKICNVISLQVLNNDIIVVAEESKPSITNTIFNFLCENISNNYSVLFHDKTEINNINSILDKILKNIHYSYFCSGELVCYTYLEKNLKPLNTKFFEDTNLKLIKNIMNCDENAVAEILNKTFIEDIRGNFDTSSLILLRKWLLLCTNIISNISQVGFVRTKYSSVEYECENYITYFTTAIKKMNSMEISKHTINAILYTFENYNNFDLSLSNMADILNVSKMHLSRVFKKDTGETYLSFLLCIRIFFAKNYLCNSNYKVREIANLVGYEDAHYFTKIFKKYTSMTPKEFKEISLEDINESIIN